MYTTAPGNKVIRDDSKEWGGCANSNNSNKTFYIILGITAVVVVAAGGFWWWKSKSSQTPKSSYNKSYSTENYRFLSHYPSYMLS
jgi:hypothetical protein